jgi:hypothetical protein
MPTRPTSGAVKVRNVPNVGGAITWNGNTFSVALARGVGLEPERIMAAGIDVGGQGDAFPAASWTASG